MLAALAVIGAVLLLSSLFACGETERATPDLVEIVVPEGSAARLRAGEEVVVMPERLELRVGQTLLIRNDDVEEASVGPYAVGAGKTLSIRYGQAGTFEGFCPLSENDRYEIVIED
ncbi:MAG: hypothetical protein ACO1PW_02360 [Actinomycetota bacterium]